MGSSTREVRSLFCIHLSFSHCLGNYRSYNQTPYTLKMADGGPVPCVGAADLPIQIGNKVFLQHVLIADIEAPFVLGYDFLFKNNCLLNIREGTLNFEDQIVQCVPESKMSSVFKISLGEATVIPANSEIITYGTFKENKPHFFYRNIRTVR